MSTCVECGKTMGVGRGVSDHVCRSVPGNPEIGGYASFLESSHPAVDPVPEVDAGEPDPDEPDTDLEPPDVMHGVTDEF